MRCPRHRALSVLIVRSGCTAECECRIACMPHEVRMRNVRPGRSPGTRAGPDSGYLTGSLAGPPCGSHAGCTNSGIRGCSVRVWSGVLRTVVGRRCRSATEPLRPPVACVWSVEWLLGRRPWQGAYLLRFARDVGDRPVFDDLCVADAMDRDPFGLDIPVRRGDSLRVLPGARLGP